MTAKRKSRGPALPDRVPLAQLKASFSRYVREVEKSGSALTITHHGRDAAVLAPVRPAEAQAPLAIRPPLEDRPLGELIKGGLPGGQRIAAEAIKRAMDEGREDRL